MGLEMTELLMACEEEFGVQIEETPQLYNVRTVGDLHQYFIKLMGDQTSLRCPRVRVFFSLRRALVRRLSIEKGAVKLDTPLPDLFPKPGRRERWYAFSRDVPFSVPKLRTTIPTRSIVWIAVGVGLPLSGLLGLTLYSLLGAQALFVIPVLLYFVPATLFLLVRPTLQTTLPAHTVGELVEDVVASKYWGAANDVPWDENTVWLRLREIVAERFDVPMAEIGPETDFWKDLGAG